MSSDVYTFTDYFEKGGLEETAVFKERMVYPYN